MTNKQGYRKDLEERRVSSLATLLENASSSHYMNEDRIIDAITAGDMDQLDEIFEQINIEDLTDYLKSLDPGHFLRAYKHFLRSVNTLCRVAAKNGGVLGVYAHIISERYLCFIEKADSEEYLTEVVFSNIYHEYCETVRDFSTSTYSPRIKEIAVYVTEHLTSPLTLNDMAQKVDMHSVHLARKFKHETGITFINYMNQQRVCLAKYYFCLDKYQLSEVAYLSGFNSHSYFTKVFKKLTGKTPTQYIRRLPSNG